MTQLSAAVAADPDAVYASFTGWAEDQGLTPYPAQAEALLEKLSGGRGPGGVRRRQER